jgi:hypothetical protein
MAEASASGYGRRKITMPPKAKSTPHVPEQAAPKKMLRNTPLLSSQQEVTNVERQQLISEAAYFRAQERGFTPGRELEDWLAAEIQIEELMGKTAAISKSKAS